MRVTHGGQLSHGINMRNVEFKNSNSKEKEYMFNYVDEIYERCD